MSKNVAGYRIDAVDADGVVRHVEYVRLAGATCEAVAFGDSSEFPAGYPMLRRAVRTFLGARGYAVMVRRVRPVAP